VLHGEDPVRRLRLRLTVGADAYGPAERPVIRAADLTGPEALEVGPAVCAYLQQTELEKAQQQGAELDPAAPLPERYRREADDPATGYVGHRVLIAELAERVVGVVVLAERDGIAEIKRLWALPEVRGRGVGSALLDGAVREAAALGATEVRLSVWDWRANALGLYESRGFARVPSWDDRERLVCMVRPV
jgi:ribosomal protein S18 acetylase RimI-like enzyme